ncbi:cysteine desulfurase family protein [Chelatococcus sp. SYSU_G07232]|uniref:Cysteine desulfurase n=1 Tax=Chelatococcus albus TaxID=3047466 RepID=A0ABT7ABI7_9HYPH|nr:cysteine desulfurase family protein [Chelatococcus sp. SYSU_G07232]MDJ1156718.1 cysteine desulfurase family protein [Chelatococcus sp. SYSU_G07232]
MTTERTYLDYNATAPVRPAVMEAMARALALTGNPSSVHSEGRTVRRLVEEAREKVAALVGARPQNVIFTSGGSEANNTALTPTLGCCGREEPLALCLVGATEHPSVLEGARFPAHRVERVPVDRQGLADLSWLERRLSRLADERPGGRALVSLQFANNETGVVQPVSEAVRLVHARDGMVHTDAVQAAGKIPIDVAGLGADLMTLSAHKFGGPQGVGALVLGHEAIEIRERLVRGGGQQRGYRAGTENVAGIVGFGVAASLALDEIEDYSARIGALRDRLQDEVRRIAPDAVIFGAGVDRLPNTLAFAVPGLRAETLLMALDLEGVAVSSGSACSSGKVRRSHVLDAMGVARDVAEGALRVSLGWASEEADVTRFATAFAKVAGALISRRAGRQAA